MPLGKYLVKRNDEGYRDFLQELWGYRNHWKSGTNKNLNQPDVYSLSRKVFLQWHGNCATFKVQSNTLCGLPSYCLNALDYNPNIFVPLKPIKLQELWGIQSLCANFGIFTEKHHTTQSNLSGDFRNYLLTYSVPTGKRSHSGPKLIFGGVYSTTLNWLSMADYS